MFMHTAKTWDSPFTGVARRKCVSMTREVKGASARGAVQQAPGHTLDNAAPSKGQKDGPQLLPFQLTLCYSGQR